MGFADRFDRLGVILFDGIAQPRVTFEKNVVLENRRLARVYQVTWFVTFVFIIWKTIFVDEFLVETEVDGIIDLWVDGLRQEAPLLEQQRLVLESDICTRQREHDYAWSADWLYINNTCSELCTAADQGKSCTTTDEAYHQNHDNVLFVTYSQVTLVEPGDSIAASAAGQKNYFVPFVEAFSVGIAVAHMFSIGSKMDLSEELSVVREEPVIILRKAGEPFRAFHSGAPVLVTVRELLDIAGVTLDSIQPQLGPNVLDPEEYAGIDARGVLGRIAGVELTIEVSYYNYPKYDYSSVYSEWSGSVFYIDVVANQAGWVSHVTRDMIDSRETKYVARDYGVMVSYRFLGVQQHFDLSFFFVTMMSAFVLLRLPTLLVMYLAMFGMGHLSTIYHNVLRERVNVQDQCASVATKMIQLSSMYRELLCDGQTDIIRARLYDVLKHRSDLLDAQEIEHFVQYVFQIFRNDSAKSCDAVVDQEHIDEYGLAYASLKCEKLDLEMLVGLFNKDRFCPKTGNAGFLERFFMQDDLRHAILSAQSPAARGMHLISGRWSQHSKGHISITKETCSDAFTVPLPPSIPVIEGDEPEVDKPPSTKSHECSDGTLLLEARVVALERAVASFEDAKPSAALQPPSGIGKTSHQVVSEGSQTLLEPILASEHLEAYLRKVDAMSAQMIRMECIAEILQQQIDSLTQKHVDDSISALLHPSSPLSPPSSVAKSDPGRVSALFHPQVQERLPPKSAAPSSLATDDPGRVSSCQLRPTSGEQERSHVSQASRHINAGAAAPSSPRADS